MNSVEQVLIFRVHADARSRSCICVYMLYLHFRIFNRYACHAHMPIHTHTHTGMCQRQGFCLTWSQETRKCTDPVPFEHILPRLESAGASQVRTYGFVVFRGRLVSLLLVSLENPPKEKVASKTASLKKGEETKGVASKKGCPQQKHGVPGSPQNMGFPLEPLQASSTLKRRTPPL